MLVAAFDGEISIIVPVAGSRIHDELGSFRAEPPDERHHRVGPDRTTFHVPRDKDIDTQMVHDLRAMLADAQLVTPDVDR